MSEKENANETESVTERGTARKGIGKEIEIGTETETERRAGLQEMWSMPPSGDQVSERLYFVLVLRVSSTYTCFEEVRPLL